MSERSRIAVMSFIVVAVIGALAYEWTPPNREVANDWTRHREVAHALGAWEGQVYTNSLEALLGSRAQGFRVFEVDLEFTADGVLVATYGWPTGRMDLASFRQAGADAGYTALTFRELLEIFASWTDCYLILDTKGDAAPVWREVREIAAATLPDSLERLIPQLYSPTRRQMAESARFRRVLLTLYRTAAPDRVILRFLEQSGINVITAPPARLSTAFLRDLDDLGVRVYAHTINDTDSLEALIRSGVHGVYTDSLCCQAFDSKGISRR